MIHISLFSGIGGFDLAAEWVGWTNGASCEISEFPRKVLQYHFPNAYHHDDIHTLTYEKLDYELTKRFGENWRTNGIILTGGFPCQPYSTAGKRQGKNDSRHLWPEMLRIIREVKPTWIVGENVYGLVSWNGGMVFDEVHTNLETEGFEVQAYVLPAAGVNAPHRRDRVWFVAHSNECRSEKSILQHSDLSTGSVRNNEQIASNTTSDRRQRTGERFEVEEGLQQESRAAGQLEGRLEGLRSTGITSDSGIEHSSSRGENQETQRSRSGKDDEQEIGSEQTERINGLLGLERISSHTSIAGQQELHIPSEPEGKGYSSGSIDADASDSTEHGLEGCAGKSIQGGIDGFTRQYNEVDGFRYWQDFPTTEPAIRRGDDGISKLLDGITFSKWRNESIKAYGNAVVPQVVYQIFKAIQMYEQIQQQEDNSRWDYI